MSLLRPPNVRPPGQPGSRLDWLYHPGVPTLGAILFIIVLGGLSVYVEALLSWRHEFAEITRIADPSRDFHEPDERDVVRLSRFIVARSSLVANAVDADPDTCATHLAEQLGYLLDAPGVQPDIAAIVGVCGSGVPMAHVATGLPRLVVLRPVFDRDGRHRLTRITVVETTAEPSLVDAVGRPSVLISLFSLAGLAGLLAWHWGRSTHRRLADLWVAASLDHQTGMLRRETFVAWLSGAIAEARAGGSGLSVLCVDIDNLKAINDGLGHAAGDAAIHLVAGEISARLSGGVVGRLGGDEFSVMLGGARLAAALAVAEGIRAAIEAATVDSAAGPVRTTVSIGVAELAPADDAAGLLKRADAALYGAKGISRNTIRAAAPPG